MDNITALKNNVEYNTFMNLLYFKPQRSSFKKGIIGTIEYKFKCHKFKKNEILPVYNNLLNLSPTFTTMCVYADFIRLLERVFFYKNALITDKEDINERIISDSELNSNKKILILDLNKENVTIIFTMYTKDTDEIIETKVKYNFGKKSTMNYTIVNREVHYDSIHSENLMITILDRLKKAMANLFMEYYNKI